MNIFYSTPDKLSLRIEQTLQVHQMALEKREIDEQNRLFEEWSAKRRETFIAQRRRAAARSKLSSLDKEKAELEERLKFDDRLV